MKFNQQNDIYNLAVQNLNMKVESPDIGWHGPKDRILSIDFHPKTNQLVSGGSDDQKYVEQEIQGTEGCIKLWEIGTKGDKIDIKISYGLHQADTNVNVVKYSPHGQLLASGADDRSITIWQKRLNTVTIHKADKMMRWSAKSKLAGHSEDIIDLKWTKDSKYLVSAGMDKRMFIFDVEKKYHVKVLDQHQKMVQGIAIDPNFQFIISCSNDRSARIWKNVKTKKCQTAFYCRKLLKRFVQNKTQDIFQGQKNQGFRMFIDESIPTFFRRPDISPDGEFFLFPAGLWKRSPQANSEYGAFLYRKNYLQKPTLFIPTKGQPTFLCKFCPVLYKKPDSKGGLFAMDYYMVFAVATSSSVLVFSTQSTKLLFGMGNYHYASLTDLSWRGGKMLAVSSSDGYCSFLIFQDGVFGEVYQSQGELADKMKVPQITSKIESEPKMLQEPQEQKIEYRQTSNGVKRKVIIPKKISQI